MVKKKGKARQDKYYYLAKETGYRARSAFKLLQLNKKYNFLQSSQVLVDLCAAPGGWLQVASEHMPMSSIIIGVDLVPIKPVPRCITFQDDITKESCYNQIRQELQQWKADCFLHDGSPNVGKSWLQDAYSQSVLTLHALKLACDFLKKGGWFITKVFRSKDYQALMWVLQQLFRKVHATKPQASRNESAEIFVVCENYKCPDKIDKKFFDIRHVFEDVESDLKRVRVADFKSDKKKKAIGYDDDNHGLLFKTKTVTEFLQSPTPLQMLSEINRLEFDDDTLKDDPYITKDLIESLNDIKLLGSRDIRRLLRWHEKVKKKQLKKENENEEKDADREEDSDLEIERQLEEIKEEETRHLKKKKRDVLKERKKLRERMSHSGQSSFSHSDMQLFALDQLQSSKEMIAVADADIDQVPDDFDNDDVTSVSEKYTNDPSMEISDDGSDYIESNDEDIDTDNEEDFSSDDESVIDEVKAYKKLAEQDMESENKDEKVEEGNPLLKDINNRPNPNLWFDKEIFKKIEENDDELNEVRHAEKLYEDKVNKENKKKKSVTNKIEERKNAYQSDSDTSDSDYDLNEDFVSDSDDENQKNYGGNGVKKGKLTAEELALGTAIATSKKKKRDLIDESFNRNTFNEDECDLPDWYVEEERKMVKHDFIRSHISKADIHYYRSKDLQINAKTIKKIAEAKARKKKKLTKKREQVRKQAENISDSVTMSSAEKAAQIKAIYKKAGLLNKKKENKTLVFARRGTGKKVSRPPGVRGKFAVVDRRMKKDKRAQLKNDKKKKRSLKAKGRKRRR